MIVSVVKTVIHILVSANQYLDQVQEKNRSKTKMIKEIIFLFVLSVAVMHATVCVKI